VRRLVQRGDVALVLLLLAAGATGFLLLKLLGPHGRPAEVKILIRERCLVVPLADTTLALAGPLGETEITIEDGKVWVSSAPCPNKLCMRQGKIAKPGESIICLPNRLVITIQGAKQPDAVTY